MAAAAAAAAAAPGRPEPTGEPLTRPVTPRIGPPADPSDGETVRTFHPRRSALGPARRSALADLWPHHGFVVDDPERPAPLLPDGTLDTGRLFGRRAPLVLEIGSGMGEAVLAMAAADPDRDYLAVEAHVPGVANLVVRLAAGGPPNVRVALGDALALLRTRLAPGSLDAVHAFFPDPWPKTRHHKRRLVRPDRVALLADRLRPGGTLHLATDWVAYAEEMLAVVAAEPLLANPSGGFAARPSRRPVTKFEAKALAEGREALDVVAVRR